MFLFQVLKRRTIEGNVHGFIYVFLPVFCPPTHPQSPPTLSDACQNVGQQTLHFAPLPAINLDLFFSF